MDPTDCEVTITCPMCDIFGQLARDRMLFIYQDIDAIMATTMVAQLFWLDQQSPKEEITICINSGGGTILNGLFTIYDTLQYIRAPIKTVCIGEAYSGAAMILAAGTKGKRFAYPNANIMLHSVQSGVDGSQAEIEKESKRLKVLNQSLMQMISKHTGQSVSKVTKDCQKDKYFNSKEALEYGIIDEIIKPSKKVK